MSAEMGKLKREALGRNREMRRRLRILRAPCRRLPARPAGRHRSQRAVMFPTSRSVACSRSCRGTSRSGRCSASSRRRLMAGNVALLKHATNVPRCADVIAEMLANAGLPDGVFGVLHIDNDMAAKVIADPRVHAVTLTGSERAGRSVAATAGRQSQEMRARTRRQRSFRRARRCRPRQDHSDGDQLALRQRGADLHRRQALHRHRRDRG